MALERVHTLAGDHVPNLGGIVKGACHDLVTLRVEVERDNLSLVAVQAK